jgi:hypothetical protein
MSRCFFARPLLARWLLSQTGFSLTIHVSTGPFKKDKRKFLSSLVLRALLPKTHICQQRQIWGTKAFLVSWPWGSGAMGG